MTPAQRNGELAAMLTLSRRYEAGAPTLGAARALLADPSPKDASLAVLGATALCALSALALAVAVIVGPLIGPPDSPRPAAVRTLS